MKRGVITLIHKKGNKHEIINWCPISLLNCYYKVFAKLVANRLRQVVEYYIGDHLTCSIPGRRVLDSLILLRDTIYFAQSNNLALIAEQVDLEKASDKLSLGFLWHVLQKIGPPQGLLKIIVGMYEGISSQVLVNGCQVKTSLLSQE